MKEKITLIGAGNIGLAMANGLVESKLYQAEDIILTRRKIERLETWQKRGFLVYKNNIKAIEKAKTVILAVEPQQLDGVLKEVSDTICNIKPLIISVVTGVEIARIKSFFNKEVDVVRAMPNTAISIRESMTCLAGNSLKPDGINRARNIFNAVGKTEVIDEELMGSATALAACGLAFFMRAVRAASQGGIEIGFHSDKALAIAAQTAKGAAQLLLANDSHPEPEIDRVTTPRGVTIAGLNQMEHDGFSSAMIKGIVTAAAKSEKIYSKS